MAPTRPSLSPQRRRIDSNSRALGGADPKTQKGAAKPAVKVEPGEKIVYVIKPLCMARTQRHIITCTNHALIPCVSVNPRVSGSKAPSVEDKNTRVSRKHRDKGAKPENRPNEFAKEGRKGTPNICSISQVCISQVHMTTKR